MLKKLTIIFALVIIINANKITAQVLSVGPIAGVNVSTISNFAFTKNLVGLSIGGFANYSINEHFGIGAKILYSQLGTGFTNKSDIVRLNYLQVPITGIYYFGDVGNKFRPKFFIGPYIGTLIKAADTNGNLIVGTDGQKVYNNVDLGGLAGIGFNYLIQSRTWLNVDAGYGRSLGDITKTGSNTYKNESFNLNIGVSFPIGN
jgi:Outer membrane protein beta-barrel domain